MADLYIVTREPLPEKLEGSHSHYYLGPLGKSERLSIEDCFHRAGEEVKLPENLSAIILPDIAPNEVALQEAVTLLEFGLALITKSGHPCFRLAAAFVGGKCAHARSVTNRKLAAPEFVKTMTGTAAAQWLRRCALAQKSLKNRLHITAHRYVRFARSGGDADGLMDLCISLESLLDSQSEVSFRFGVCLAKVIGGRGIIAMQKAELLGKLYELRSKLAHGDPGASRLTKKLEPQVGAIGQLAKEILTKYVLYTSEHSRAEWKDHIRESLFT